MASGEVMARVITTNDPEFDDVFDAVLCEIVLNRNAIAERREIGEESFRQWIYQQIVSIASKLGFIIRDISEFGKDLVYGFKKGFAAGQEKARRRSIRAREGML